MKGISFVISTAATIGFASAAYAGSGCNYGNLQADATNHSNPEMLISQPGENKVDPKWLALIKEQETEQVETQPIVVHN